MILTKMGYGYGYFSREARENLGYSYGYGYGYGYFSREARENFGVQLLVIGTVIVIFRAKRAKILRYSYGYRYGYGYILNQNGGTVMGVR